MISGRASFGRALIYPGRYRPHVKSSANQEPREYNSTTRVLFLSPFRACSIYTCRYITIDASGYRSCKPLSLPPPPALSLPFSPFCTCTFVGRRSGRRKRKFHSLRVFRVLDSIRLFFLRRIIHYFPISLILLLVPKKIAIRPFFLEQGIFWKNWRYS